MTPLSVLTAFCEVTWFRLVPLLVYGLLSTRSSRPMRAGAAFALAAWTALSIASQVSLSSLACAAAATGFVAASAWVVHPLAGALRRGAITRAGAGTLFAFGYLLLPGIALPAELAVCFLVLGWEAALAAYSYVVETSKPAAQASLAECAFFLCVSPLLVYAPASTLALRSPVSIPRALTRVLLGLLVLAAAIPLAMPRALPWAEALGRLDGYAAFAANGVLVFLARYAALSGLASVHIGALRVLGFELPERYRYPFLARSPADFWRRWNTYVGDWLKRYLFLPLSRVLARARIPALRRAARPLSIAATMLSMGAYHDAYVYSAELELHTSGTLAFGGAAVLMSAWLVPASLMRRPRVRRAFAELRALRPAHAVLARAAVLHAACAVAWLFTRA